MNPELANWRGVGGWEGCWEMNQPARRQGNLTHSETENQNNYGFPNLKHSLDIWRYFQSMLIFPVSFKN